MTYEEFKFAAKNTWETEPISCTCQFLFSSNPPEFCDKPTAKAYTAMGKGWMALCALHGIKHREAFVIEELILSGETFA